MRSCAPPRACSSRRRREGLDPQRGRRGARAPARRGRGARPARVGNHERLPGARGARARAAPTATATRRGARWRRCCASASRSSTRRCRSTTPAAVACSISSRAREPSRARRMHVLVGVIGGLLVAAMLWEIFVAFLLPRRVKRDPRLVRAVFVRVWRPWRAAGARAAAGRRRRAARHLRAVRPGDRAGAVGRGDDVRLRVPAVGRRLAPRPGRRERGLRQRPLLRGRHDGLELARRPRRARHVRAHRADHRRGQRPGGAGDRDRLPALALSGVLASRGDRVAAGRARGLAAERRAACTALGRAGRLAGSGRVPRAAGSSGWRS